MITNHQALQIVLSSISTIPSKKNLLLDSNNSVLRQDLLADRDLPPFNRVMFDGFAINSNFLSQKVFNVFASQAAGNPPKTLDPIEGAIEVMTGSSLPIGCDIVIPYEQTLRNKNQIEIKNEALELDPYSNIHIQGSDKKTGDLLCTGGKKTNASILATAASCGYDVLDTSPKIKIAIITSGDELVEVESTPEPYQIRKSNGLALKNILSKFGDNHFSIFHFSDDLHSIEKGLMNILQNNDLVLLSGGISKGKKDFIPQALENCGVEKKFQWVKQKPGKPFWFGIAKDHKPIFGLPGNPVSTISCALYYVIPAIRKMLGENSPKSIFAKLKKEVSFKPSLTYFLPVSTEFSEKAEFLATPIPTANSGDYSSLIQTDGFVVLPAEDRSKFKTGEVFPYYAW